MHAARHHLSDPKSLLLHSGAGLAGDLSSDLNVIAKIYLKFIFNFSDYNSVQNSTRGGQERVTHPVFYKKIGALRAQNLHIHILSQYIKNTKTCKLSLDVTTFATLL